MKKIFSSIILVVTFPFRLLRKTKIDNFVGGLIFGAVFSLVVNIATVQIQELISKQRALEALENEIMMNTLQAKDILKKNSGASEKDTRINYFYYSPSYSTDLYTQSSEPLRYMGQLDSDVQGRIMAFYSTILKPANAYVNRANNIIEQKLPICFSDHFIFKEKNIECLLLEGSIRITENLAADLVSQYGNEVLNYFHPTQDRLKSWPLRLLMGTKSTRILSGQ